METDTDPGSKGTSIFSFLKKKHPKKEDKSSRNIQQILKSDIEESKKQMIRGVMELSELCAREIMIPRVDIIAIKENTSLKEIVTIATVAGHSRIPVFNTSIDEISGILYVKVLLEYILDRRKKFDVKKKLHKPLFIPETMPLDELLLEFKKKRQHLAIVVDEYGGVAGLVTMEDILEEIVGDINDEFDEQEKPECIKVDSSLYDVDSRMSIADLNEEMHLSLPSEEFDTVGGLVFDLFGKIPNKKDSIDYEGMQFTVKDIVGTRINRVLININPIQNKD